MHARDRLSSIRLRAKLKPPTFGLPPYPTSCSYPPNLAKRQAGCRLRGLFEEGLAGSPEGEVSTRCVWRSRQILLPCQHLYRWDEKVDPRSRMALSYQ